MSRRKLAGNAVASIASVVVGGLILIVTYRVLIGTLGAEQVGVWSLVMAVAAAARLGDFGIGNGVVKFVAADLGAGARDEAAATVGFGLVALAALMTLICVALLPVLPGLLDRVLQDPAHREAAAGLVPWALASLWFGTLGSLLCGALDGAQRTDLRAWATIAAGLGQLVALVLLLPRHGLPILGPLQLLNSLLLVVFAGAGAWRVIAAPAAAWARWTRPRMKALLHYGSSFQLAALAQLAFEPTVKWLLGLFGSLSQVAWFEMGNRAASQLRLVIAAAYQMLTPYMAARIGRDGEDRPALARAYRQSWQLLMTLAVPYYVLAAALLPALLSLWLGRVQADFIAIGLICLAGWAVNTLALPSFVLYLAIGRLRWSIATQVSTALLNLLLAIPLGWAWGGSGVIVGAMLALALGSGVVVVAFHREYGIARRDLLDRRDVWVLMAGVAALLATHALLRPVITAPPGAATSLAPWLVGLLPAAAFAVFTLAVQWQGPVRALLTRRRESAD